jgi:hypothetical protein
MMTKDSITLDNAYTHFVAFEAASGGSPAQHQLLSQLCWARR